MNVFDDSNFDSFDSFDSFSFDSFDSFDSFSFDSFDSFDSFSFDYSGKGTDYTKNQQDIVSNMVVSLVNILNIQNEIFDMNTESEKCMQPIIAAYTGMMYIIQTIVSLMYSKTIESMTGNDGNNDESEDNNNKTKQSIQSKQSIGDAFKVMAELMQDNQEGMDALNLIAKIVYLEQKAIQHISEQFKSHNIIQVGIIERHKEMKKNNVE